MKSIKKPQINNNETVYELKSAIIHGYEYTKTYYNMENNVPVRCENGDDSCLTIINIRKIGDTSEKKRAFLFSEGYIGAEKSYNEDGTKSKSAARKDGFGVSYLIKYIENARENGVDNFHVMFLSDKETSENQAALYAKAIEDITTDNVEKTYIWSHSKAGLLTLRAFQKMKESQDEESKKVLGKVKAVITSMPTKGLDTVNREKMVNKLENNTVINFLPFSGFIKTGILSFYDKFLYKPTPAQVDLKKSNTELALRPIQNGRFAKIFNALWGNTSFRNKVNNTPEVPYDEGYLKRTVGEESLEKIDDVDYKVLPVNLDFRDALESLVKHAQIMPLISRKLFIFLKEFIKRVLLKILSKEKGDGIITYSEQGLDKQGKPDIRAKYKTDVVVKAGHDIPTKPDALETIGKELLDEDER